MKASDTLGFDLRQLLSLLLCYVLAACHANQRTAPLERWRTSSPSDARVKDTTPPVPLDEHRFEVQVSNNGRNSTEVSAWINRYNPQHVIAAQMGSGVSGEQFQLAASFDGGMTWSLQDLPNADDVVFRADPMVTLSPDGSAHVVSIPVGAGNRPIGVEVARSEDGGITWSNWQRISANIGQDDKTAFAVDDNFFSPYFGRLYAVWKWVSGGIYLSRSFDNGVTWEPPRDIGGLSVAGLDVAIASNGEVLISANQGGFARSIFLLKSTDGGDTFDSRRVSRVRAGFEVKPRGACSFNGAHVQTSIGVQRAAGRDSNQIWVSWNDLREGVDSSCHAACGSANSCRSGVYVAHSHDLGETFEAATRIPGLYSEAGDQYFSWLTVDPDSGDLVTLFKDTGDDPIRLAAHAVTNRSTDDGASWQGAQRASSVASGTNNWQGDYLAIRSAGGRSIGVWQDFRQGNGELFAAVSAPPNAEMKLNDGLGGVWNFLDGERPVLSAGMVLDLVNASNHPNGENSIVGAMFSHDLATDARIAGVGQRWFTIQGQFAPGNDQAIASVFQVLGGDFQGVAAGTTRLVGRAWLQFSSCEEGIFSIYLFDGEIKQTWRMLRTFPQDVDECQYQSNGVPVSPTED